MDVFNSTSRFLKNNIGSGVGGGIGGAWSASSLNDKAHPENDGRNRWLMTGVGLGAGLASGPILSSLSKLRSL